ncbi:MAG: RNA-binding transcriptional accessory protein, partial [Clostridiales bacterium]|nr:RNA-binding transcriptional accessory protein [Clostridiales bacterium]
DIILAQEITSGDVLDVCAPYVSEEKGVLSAQDALNGAKDIIAERISDDANMRKALRALLYEMGTLEAKLDPKDPNNQKKVTYEMYATFSEKIAAIPSHRILAVNRGEADECLKVSIHVDEEAARNKIKAAYKKESIFSAVLDETIADSYERLIFPSIEREVRNELTDKANEQAIKMFEQNLKPLLMQPPLKGKVILGLDPAYRTGCKIAVIDASGNVLDHTVVYPTPPQKKTEEAKATLKKLIDKHKVDVISIGNGTASKESEIFVAELIKECSRPVSYAVVNEAGASVYSASKLGAEEFPDLTVEYRSAISIARRLLDPLAELIKIDVKSIGVGQYQHDMPQKRLSEVLTGVVEDCVNSVGVDLNTASYSLLSFVSGLNTSIAKNIVKFREEQPFTSREQLRKVPKLGPKAFEQCAGFLRITGGDNVLDNTAVHPEAYEATEKLLARYGKSEEDVRSGNLGDLAGKVNAEGAKKVAQELNVGEPTLIDVLEEIAKPGRDIRDSLPAPLLRADLMDINDLNVGMELTGTVRNVIDFGAFVDIGVHHDGLVHISEISDRYIKHPSEALKVGDVVRVRVIGVDPQKKRINLSMKSPEGAQKKEDGEPRSRAPKRDTRDRREFRDRTGDRNRSANGGERSLDDMLKALQNKFAKK